MPALGTGVARLSALLRMIALGAAVIVAGTVLTVSVWLASELDAAARAHAEPMIEGGLAAMRGSNEAVVRDYAEWTAAYEHVRDNDVEWIDANIGTGATVTGTMDALLLTGAPLSGTLGWIAGETEAPMPAEMADRFAAIALAAAAEAPVDITAAAASTFAWVDGTLWLVSFTRVIPHDSAIPTDEPLALLISAMRMDAAVMEQLGAAFLIDGLRLGVDPVAGFATMPLMGLRGPVAHLMWPPPAPGTEALRAVAPPLAFALIVGGAALLFGTLAVGRLAARLERALLAAEGADRTKAEFIATLSHELRTPMNGIVGMLDLLATTELSDKQRAFLDVANRSAESQVEMIERLLEFGQVESGQAHLSAAPLKPAEMLREVVALAGPQAERKGLHLTLSVKGPVDTHVMGDRVALRQIAVNLLGNAIKFTERGSVSVTLTARERFGMMQLSLSVADTGPGIPVSIQSQIFETFSRGEAKTSRMTGGLGLGLSISRRIAELMGGSLTVRSAPGKGATFTLSVSLETAPEELTRMEDAA